MADWYYTAKGQQAGPVDLQTLRQMLSTASLSHGDLVYGPGLAQWTPAGQVPALSTGVAEANAPTVMQASPGAGGASMIGYRGVETETTGLSAVAMDAMRKTKPWVRFISIMSFIVAAFAALGGISMMLIIATVGKGRASGVPSWLGGVYLALAALYVIPGVLLTRYANGIGNLMRTQRMSDVERALGAQKAFWKYTGIMLIVVMCVYAVVIVAVIALHGRL